MILINLLPQELRRKEVKKTKVPYRLIAFSVFFVFLIISIYNLYLYVQIREKYGGLQKEWHSLEKQNAEADNLQTQLGSSILAEVDFYDTLIDPPLETAQVLNLVSDLMPSSVWFTEFKFERKGKEIHLVLNGLSENIKQDSKLVEIQSFANKLKDEMEKFLFPKTPSWPGFGQPKIKVAVTTTSRKAESEQTEITQFTATLQTDGFTQK